MQQQHQALSIGAVVVNRQQLTAIGQLHQHVLTLINRQARRFQGVAQGLQIPAPPGQASLEAGCCDLTPTGLAQRFKESATSPARRCGLPLGPVHLGAGVTAAAAGSMDQCRTPCASSALGAAATPVAPRKKKGLVLGNWASHLTRLDGRKLVTPEAFSLRRSTQKGSVTFGQARGWTSHSSVIRMGLNESAERNRPPEPAANTSLRTPLPGSGVFFWPSPGKTQYAPVHGVHPSTDRSPTGRKPGQPGALAGAALPRRQRGGEQRRRAAP